MITATIRQSITIFWLSIMVAMPISAAPTDPTAPADRPRVILIKPVVLCDDDGSHPARTAFPKQLVDQVYSSAGIEFIYLEPARWNFGAARRGEINLNEIVKQGHLQSRISNDPQIVTMIFVSAVDGKSTPLGRGLQHGNICFISLGNDQTNDDPAMQAFVVAHEVGHCLGLRHAIDDPKITDQSNNIQGDGPFMQRLSVSALQPSQRDTLLRSPLVIERVKCLTAKESRVVLNDESWFPFHTRASADVLRFALGLPADSPIPADPTEKTTFARKQHAAMAMDFTPDEEAFLKHQVATINRKIASRWPMLARVPWQFVKVKSGFCNDYPHTRGLVTVLSETAIRRLATNDFGASLTLFHEKIHIIQRLNPERFTSLYQKYGYTPIQLAQDEETRLNTIQNPDAPVNDWAVSLPNGVALIATSYTKTPDNHLGFQESYYQLEKHPDGTWTIGNKLADPSPVDHWRARFPTRIGYDHPNEIFAYMCAAFYPSNPNQEIPHAQGNEILDLTVSELPRIFSLIEK